MYTSQCSICNKPFDHRFPSQHVCEECKNRPCEICGKHFKRVDPYDQKYCSRECRRIGIKDPDHIAKAQAKKKANLLAKYGVDNVSKLDSVRSKISLSKTDPEFYQSEKARIAQEKKALPKITIQKCKFCGKSFESINGKAYCNDKHFSNCVVCGKEFEVPDVLQPRKTCSAECQAKLRKDSLKVEEHICEYCGKPFFSNLPFTRYCEGPHFKTCAICRHEFLIDLSSGLSSTPSTCSDICKEELKKRTSIDRYGVPFPCQTEQARENSRLRSIADTEKRMKTCFDRYGVFNVAQIDSVKAKISSAIGSEDNQKKMRETMQKRYGVNYAMQSTALAAKQRSFKSQYTTMDGTKTDSQWEVNFYNFLKRNNIDFEYNTVTIPYEYNGKKHVLHVDFKVGDLLIEVKGDHLLEGIGEGVPIAEKIKVYKKNHVVIVCGSNVNGMFGKPNSTKSNGLKYLNKCPEPLIGVDINLFSRPAFPFAEDRPPCFYKVKVDNNRSSLEAFYDEKIRWKMIVNRIQYSGGFIDAKQVLNAMNVTRTCKQPSWFSKTLAKRIISEYCHSNTIVDPFAGWGMRHDAAIELGRSYKGCDFNPDLVTWHNEHGRSIQFADANEFKTDEECSVFICPPYSDPVTGKCFEDYNFEGFDNSAKALSQCDWLKIVMNNIPNAHEYVMVCKIVDPGFENYIVEKIDNRSHFGTNNEYILVVPNTDHLV